MLLTLITFLIPGLSFITPMDLASSIMSTGVVRTDTSTALVRRTGSLGITTMSNMTAMEHLTIIITTLSLSGLPRPQCWYGTRLSILRPIVLPHRLLSLRTRIS